MVDVLEVFVTTTKSNGDANDTRRTISFSVEFARVYAIPVFPQIWRIPRVNRVAPIAQSKGRIIHDLVALWVRGPPTFRGIFAERFEQRDSHHCPTKLCVAGDPRFREVERACRAMTRMEEFRRVRILRSSTDRSFTGPTFLFPR